MLDGQLTVGMMVSEPRMIAVHPVDWFPEASTALTVALAVAAKGMKEPGAGFWMKVTAPEQLSVAVKAPVKSGTRIMQDPFAKDASCGITDGHVMEGGELSRVVSVATGLKPVPQPGCAISTRNCTGPVRLDQGWLLVVFGTGDQLPPLSMERHQRTMVPA